MANINKLALILLSLLVSTANSSANDGEITLQFLDIEDQVACDYLLKNVPNMIHNSTNIKVGSLATLPQLYEDAGVSELGISLLVNVWMGLANPNIENNGITRISHDLFVDPIQPLLNVCMGNDHCVLNTEVFGPGGVPVPGEPSTTNAGWVTLEHPERNFVIGEVNSKFNIDAAAAKKYTENNRGLNRAEILFLRPFDITKLPDVTLKRNEKGEVSGTLTNSSIGYLAQYFGHTFRELAKHSTMNAFAQWIDANMQLLARNRPNDVDMYFEKYVRLTNDGQVLISENYLYAIISSYSVKVWDDVEKMVLGTYIQDENYLRPLFERNTQGHISGGIKDIRAKIGDEALAKMGITPGTFFAYGSDRLAIMEGTIKKARRLFGN